jgi:para-nitrobenzyl esterase
MLARLASRLGLRVALCVVGCASEPGTAAPHDAGGAQFAPPDAAPVGGHDGGVSQPCPGAHDPAARRVLTESGTLQGVASGDSDAFLGVPFAAPPLAERRFALPERFGCFAGERGATAFGPRCPQLAEDQATVIGDEDCLQLNVWTPTTRSAALPVLVFIHGGGHAVGSAVDPMYDGAGLAGSSAGGGSGAVVVTINYRLGALGFLLHPALPTNLGMRDQLAALEWVQRNAAAFGGDPTRVTVFGESAGAVSVCTLLGMPAAAGLFARAIVQSGSCRQRDAQRYAQALAEWLPNSGCAGAADEPACLRQLDVATLVRTEPTGFPSVAALGQVYSSHVDGELLPVHTEAAWQAGTALGDVSVVIGSNRDETAAGVPTNLDEASYEQLVRASFGPLADQVLAQYPVSAFASPSAAYVALSSEAKFICGARRAANLASAGGVDARLYMFSYDAYTAFNRTPAATHGLELVYIFGTFQAIPIGAAGYQPNPSDQAMRDSLQARWLSFARDGVPTEPTGPDWPRVNAGYLVLDAPSQLGSVEYPEARCDFWDGLTP